MVVCGQFVVRYKDIKFQDFRSDHVILTNKYNLSSLAVFDQCAKYKVLKGWPLGKS